MKTNFFLLFALLFSPLTVLAGNIVFSDPHVKAVCVENWDTGGDGELSEEEAAGVASLSTVFSFDNDVIKFPELQFFTGLSSIDKYAFRSCTNLQQIVLPASLTSISTSAFYGCSSLKEVTIPAQVKTIAEYAFSGCIGLTSLTLNEGLTTIGEYAFNSCWSLTELSIPASVTKINASSFWNCPSLNSVKVDSDNKKYDSRENSNAIIITATNTLMLGCVETVIPSSVTAIGPSSFYSNSKLQSIDIPEGVVSIGGSAFSGCTSLTNVSLPATLTTIGRSAFRGCVKLTEIWLPKGLESIGSEAFKNCGLKSIYIPESVTSIGTNAFAECSQMLEVTVEYTTPPAISVFTFPYAKLSTLYVPIGCVDAFKSADYWNEFKYIYEHLIPGDVNHDGYVNVLDVTLVIDYILDKKPENFHYEEANVNGDEYINVLDVTKIIDIILGK